MPLRLGGEELAVNDRRNIQKTINRSPNELDFKRVQLPAVADAGDIARLDRFVRRSSTQPFLQVEPGHSRQRRKSIVNTATSLDAFISSPDNRAGPTASSAKRALPREDSGTVSASRQPAAGRLHRGEPSRWHSPKWRRLSRAPGSIAPWDPSLGARSLTSPSVSMAASRRPSTTKSCGKLRPLFSPAPIREEIPDPSSARCAFQFSGFPSALAGIQSRNFSHPLFSRLRTPDVFSLGPETLAPDQLRSSLPFRTTAGV